MKAKLLSFAALVFVAACAANNDDTTSDEGPDQTEDELILRKGSVDHAAIVESGTMQLASGPTDGHLDPYNWEDPFAIHPAAYADQLSSRLAQFDRWDQKTDWKPEQAQAWNRRMSTGNYQIIDTSKPCGDFANPHTYLEIERAQLTGREHTTCGGRQPNEDAMDVTLNFLIRGPAASDQDEGAITDGVDQATKKSEAAFPYLAEMNGL